MALTWTLAELRTKVRELTSRPSTSQISDSSLNDRINDYYQNMFPMQVDVDELRGWLTQQLSPTDSGQYTMSAAVYKILEPIQLDGETIEFYQEAGQFFDTYPKDTGTAYVISDTGAGLAIGVSSKAAVLVANGVYYSIAGDSYYKASAEIALSGSNVPQSKYGAWRIEVDDDGTLYATEAGGNSTGYATPALAVKALGVESSSRACLGYVTVVDTSAAFVPGTTLLDASGVTATYTDGFASTRQHPSGVLCYNQTLYVGPKSDDWHEIKAPYIRKPDTLTSDSSVPLDVRWGLPIAYGTAIEILTSANEYEKANSHAVMFEGLIKQLNRKYLKQKQVNRVSIPGF